MVRIVRTPEGQLTIDPKGKQPGRGTYVCLETGCGPEGLGTGNLSRALKCQVTPDALSALRSALQDHLRERLGLRPQASEAQNA